MDQWDRNRKINPPGMCHTEECIALSLWRHDSPKAKF